MTMPRLLFLFASILFSLSSSAQVDLDILFNKKKLKKSNSTNYRYWRGSTHYVCLNGDCKNGQGTFAIKGNLFTLFAQGEFKNGKLNGPATVYLFNIKNKTLATRYFEKDLLAGNPKPNFFEKGVRCPDEIYSGNFTDNVLSNGSYTYYGTPAGVMWQFRDFELNYLNQHGPVKNINFKKYMFLYNYTGGFTSKSKIASDEIIVNLNSPNSQVEIKTDTTREIIKASNVKNEYICQKYINKSLVETKTLKGIEGRKAYIDNVRVQKYYTGKDPIILNRIKRSYKFTRGMTVRHKKTNAVYRVVKVNIKGCLFLNLPKNNLYPFTSNMECDIDNYEISSYNRQCGLCKGKGKIKSKSWAVSTWKIETDMQGHTKKKVVDTEYRDYTPGLAPQMGINQKAKVVSSMIECYDCHGVGFVK